VGSKQAYGLLAEKYCSRVYWNCGPMFWYFSVSLCCHRYRTVEIPSFVNIETQPIALSQTTVMAVENLN
jgi:hypothetical protein